MTTYSSQTSPNTRQKLLVYAVLASKEPFASMEDNPGLFGPVEFLSMSGLCLAVSKTSEEPSSMMFAGGWQIYGSVIASLHALGDLLPMQYGTILSFEDLRHHVADQAQEYRAILARIAGHSELCIRWIIDDEQVGPSNKSELRSNGKSTAGSEYLRKRARQSNRTAHIEHIRHVKETLDEAFCGRGIDFKTSVRRLAIASPKASLEKSKAYLVTNASLLVRRSEWNHITAIARTVRVRNELPVLVSGSWAPHSFMEIANSQLPCDASPSDLQRRAIPEALNAAQ